MKQSKYQKNKKSKLKEKAVKLYKQGLTTRDVGQILDKSHTWVANVINELSTVDKTLQE